MGALNIDSERINAISVNMSHYEKSLHKPITAYGHDSGQTSFLLSAAHNRSERSNARLCPQSGGSTFSTKFGKSQSCVQTSATMWVFAINHRKPLVNQSKQALVGLPGLFYADLLAELTEEDRFLDPMKKVIINKDVSSFNKLGAYMAQFWSGCQQLCNSRQQTGDPGIAAFGPSGASSPLATRTRGYDFCLRVYLLAISHSPNHQDL